MLVLIEFPDINKAGQQQKLLPEDRHASIEKDNGIKQQKQTRQ